MKRSSLAFLFIFAIALPVRGGELFSIPKIRIPLPFNRVDADPEKSYQLTENEGPWLIYAASFLGETGERQAHRLAIELRSKYKMSAYVYKQRFDYGDSVIGLGVDRYNNPKKMKYVHNSQFEESAVMVGDFSSFEDPKAQKVLETLKFLKPETLNATESNPTSQRMAVWREIQRRISPDQEMKKKGPMRASFITRNPLLPEEYFAPKGPDKLIVQLNKGLEYSLLDCPGEYSVRVATFRGGSTWDKEQIEQAMSDRSSGIGADKSQLAQGAVKARKLVAALRERGVEAYQFHDRHESIVTVGSFESVGQNRSDGRIEINPDVHKIMVGYGAQNKDLAGVRGLDGGVVDLKSAMAPRILEGIPFDAQPIPVQVPKPSIAADYVYGNRR